MKLRFLLFLFIAVLGRGTSMAQLNTPASNNGGLQHGIGDQVPERSIEGALQAWALARENAPHRAEACRIQLAQVYLDRHLPTKALEHSEAVLSINPASIDALHVKAGALAASGQHRAAALAWGALLNIGQDDPSITTSALKGLMLSYSAIADGKNGIAVGERLLAMHRSRGDSLSAGICANDLGQLASAEGRRLEALRYFSEAVKDLALSFPHRLVAASNRCATLISLDRTAEALRDLSLVRAQALANGEASIADRTLMLRSVALLLDGRSLDALQEASAARASAEARGDTLVLIESCDLLAHIDAKYGQYQQAQANSARAAAFREILLDQDRHAENVRHLLLEQAQRDEVQYLELFDEQQRERTRLRQLQHETDARSQKLELARIASDLRSADLQRAVEQAEAERSLALARAALQSERQMSTIQGLEIARTRQALDLFQSEKRHETQQREVELLTKDKALQAAVIERESAQRRSSLWLMLLLSAIVVGALAGLFFMQRKNRLIHAQVVQIGTINAQLNEKNSDILASIRYAQKVQRAIIPTEEQLREMLPDSFLFYKPMDIVSGDLPFIRRVGKRLFIATIDCTGHGVPAAMLSFRAYYNLNDIISTHPDLDVSGILSVLHQRIRTEGQSTTTDDMMSDGMDITLVELDLERQILWFSGAQSSLLFVRDGVCERIKGDKCSIGDGSQATDGFRKNRIDLRPGDQAYLYSDGLVHQFGGLNGRRKFSNAQLIRTISTATDRNVREIGDLLTNVHNAWQGPEPQTDDIVLIGFRIEQRVAVMAA